MVRRNLLLSVVILLLLVSLCSPFFELVDHWDSFPQSGNDIVLGVIFSLIVAGLSFLIFKPTAEPEARDSVFPAARDSLHSPLLALTLNFDPTSQRVPLRI